MPEQESTGRCNLCGESFPKGKMTKHLKECRKEAAPAASFAGTAAGKKGARRTKKKAKKKVRKGPFVHILVEGRWLPEYWMHIELPVRATLYDLDGFLRGIWLECCGHMSAFTIGKKRYMSHVQGGWGFSDDEEAEEGMGAELGEALKPRIKFHHEYDFGTTTELVLRVVSMAEGEARGRGVRVLARNDPPPIPCHSCGKPATEVCTECLYEGKGWLCDECVEKHECGEEMLLPVVNSPRVGQCGYAGPQEDRARGSS